MKDQWDEVYHVSHMDDVPVYFLANKLREMGFIVYIHSGVSVDNVWSNCGMEVANTLLDLVHNYISYDEINEESEGEKYEEYYSLLGEEEDRKLKQQLDALTISDQDEYAEGGGYNGFEGGK